jgi:hypothetical protein
MELAAARDLEGISRRAREVDAESDVDLEFLLEALADLTRRDVLPFLAGEG